MSSFDARRLLLECGTVPLSDEYRFRDNMGEEWWHKIMPFFCGAWDRGFYVQVVLQEYDFSVYSPEHAKKVTMCYAARDPERKNIRDLEGIRRSYPVLVFYLDVNRAEFPAAAPQMDRTEVSVKLELRTRAIAHELLIAKQYAERFDWEKGVVTPPITIPKIEEENLLICPDVNVERLLRTQEKTFGLRIATEAEFRNNEPNAIVQSYFRAWRENFSVETDLVFERTVEYLRTGFRSKYPKLIPASLDRCLSAHSLSSVSREQYGRYSRGRHPFHTSYIEEFRQNGFGNIGVETIDDVTDQHLIAGPQTLS